VSDGGEAGAQPAVRAVQGTLREARRAFERAYILETLERFDWSIKRTAAALGVPRPNLYRKARQLNIRLRRPESGQWS
jgi:DNA-binding NtrC family response regulator